MIRPIRHRSEDRVRAHIFLCLLAYYVECHLRRTGVPLVCQEDALDAEDAHRDPVAPARPSRDLRDKNNRRTCEDGLPLHSFSTLMQVLATLCRHHCHLHCQPDDPTTEVLTELTRLQARALELVQMYPMDHNSTSA